MGESAKNFPLDIVKIEGPHETDSVINDFMKTDISPECNIINNERLPHSQSIGTACEVDGKSENPSTDTYFHRGVIQETVVDNEPESCMSGNYNIVKQENPFEVCNGNSSTDGTSTLKSFREDSVEMVNSNCNITLENSLQSENLFDTLATDSVKEELSDVDEDIRFDMLVSPDRSGSQSQHRTGAVCSQSVTISHIQQCSMDIKVGDKFSSFASLENAIQHHEKENHVVFIRKDSKKIQNPALVDSLRYERVKFECKQGTARKSESAGLRPVQRSVKLGCKAQIKVVVKHESTGSSYLVVTKADLGHTQHTPSEAIVSTFPERRKIQPTEAIQKLLKLDNLSTRDLVQAIQDEQGLRPTAKDVHNLRAKFNKNVADDAEMKKILCNLVETGGRAEYFFSDSSSEFVCLSYQSPVMLNMLHLYSDVLLMDVTYNTNLYKYPLLTVMCVDANGRGQPVLHSFLSSEERGVIVKALEYLKASFDFTKTSCFFVDKDFSEIGAVSSVFPSVSPIVCSFHVSSTVKRALSNKGLSATQVETARALFMQMKDELTEEGYTSCKDNLVSILSSSVVEYFDVNWFSKCQYWAAHRLVDTVRLHATTTNHCESYHQKIKLRLVSSMKLSSALQALLNFDSEIVSLNAFNNLRLMSTKAIDCGDSVVNSIRNDTTHFAASLIIDQYDLMGKYVYNVVHHSDIPDMFVVSRPSTTYFTSQSSCSCPFFKNFSLPCRHIFLVRSRLSLPLYVPLPNGHRFKPRVVCDSLSVPGTIESSTSAGSSQVTTPEAKILKTTSLFKKMSSFMSLLGDTDFDAKYLCLSSLFDSWTSSSESAAPSDACSALDVVSPSSNVAAISDGCFSSNVPVIASSDFVSTSSSSVLSVASSSVSSGVASNSSSSVSSVISHSVLSDVVPVASNCFKDVVLKPVCVKGRPKKKSNFAGRKRKATR